jgi:hypothetical protein
MTCSWNVDRPALYCKFTILDLNNTFPSNAVRHRRRCQRGASLPHGPTQLIHPLKTDGRPSLFRILGSEAELQKSMLNPPPHGTTQLMQLGKLFTFYAFVVLLAARSWYVFINL